MRSKFCMVAASRGLICDTRAHEIMNGMKDTILSFLLKEFYLGGNIKFPPREFTV
jgi:hypothetical protein